MRLPTTTRQAIAFAMVVSIVAGATTSMANPLTFDADVGVGVKSRPQWEGASRRELAAYPVFALHSLSIPGLVSIGGSRLGFSMAPSIGFIDERRASSDALLRGMGDVDAAFELGARISYRWEHARIHAEARYGFGGYSGIVGALGADAVWQPLPDLTIEAGPRLAFAGDSYMGTYFSIDAVQAARSGYAAHSAEAGLKGAGAQARARFRLSPIWTLVADAKYERLIGDAGASPLVAAGDADQFSFGIGLSYRLRWSRGD